MPTIHIKLIGPDAKQALRELLSNVQYDKLKVTVKVKSTEGVLIMSDKVELNALLKDK